MTSELAALVPRVSDPPAHSVLVFVCCWRSTVFLKIKLLNSAMFYREALKIYKGMLVIIDELSEHLISTTAETWLFIVQISLLCHCFKKQ